jgi:N-acetylglucosamine-6-phosphate deacetylase
MKKKADEHYAIEGIHYATGNPVRITINKGIISDIIEIPDLKDKDSEIFIAPGLIDNQINGYAGVDFSGSSLSSYDTIKAARFIWKEGVTTFLPTLLTNSHENLIKNLKILEEAVVKDETLCNSVAGYHLEGPYISPEEGFRGCHPVQYIRKPSLKEFGEYQSAAAGRIIQITLAPEIKGAMEFIRICSNEDIVVAIGHSNGSSKQIARAVEYGARLSTHLGNGCANLIHRHNNPIWPQLANELLAISVIADGHHLSPDELKVFYKVKSPEKIILASDVIWLSGMAPGRYSFMGSEIILTEEGVLLNPELNCLAGASFPLKKGVENMMNFTGCKLSEAINMASVNVAGIYGLNDRGILAIGKRADIILFEKAGNSINITSTFVKGKIVYQGLFF